MFQKETEKKPSRLSSITKLFKRNKSGRRHASTGSMEIDHQAVHEVAKHTLFPPIAKSPNPLTSSVHSQSSEGPSRAVSRASRRSNEMPLKRKNTDEIK